MSALFSAESVQLNLLSAVSAAAARPAGASGHMCKEFYISLKHLSKGRRQRQRRRRRSQRDRQQQINLFLPQ